MSFVHDQTYANVTPKSDPEGVIKPIPNQTMTLLDLSPYHRLVSLYFLTELQFEAVDWKVLQKTTEEDAIGWRVLPVGYDRWKCRYWLFDDGRLYREATDLSVIKETDDDSTPALSSTTGTLLVFVQ